MSCLSSPPPISSSDLFLPSLPQHVLSKLQKADSDLSHAQRRDILASLLGENATDDQASAVFVETNASLIAERVASIRSDFVSRQIFDFASVDREGALRGLTSVLATLSDDDKRAVIASLGISPP